MLQSGNEKPEPEVENIMDQRLLLPICISSLNLKRRDSQLFIVDQPSKPNIIHDAVMVKHREGARFDGELFRSEIEICGSLTRSNSASLGERAAGCGNPDDLR